MTIPGCPAFIYPRHRNRILVLTVLTLVTLGANLFGIMIGLTAVLSHLLYFPVILNAYWYPRRGLVFSIVIGAIFTAMVFLFAPFDLLLALATVSRAAILVLVGCVVAFLSWHLARSEQQLLDIIEFLPDATFAIDRQGKIIAWNRALEILTGLPKASMLNRGNYEYSQPFYGDRRPMLAGLIIQGDQHSIQTYPGMREVSGIFTSEAFLPHFRGGDHGVHLRFSATALVDANGNVTGAIESIRDITEQVLTESALEMTSTRLNTLAGILRHDISRNLGVLYGQLRLGVMKFKDPAVISFIAEIQQSVGKITHQIEISREFRDIGGTPPCWMVVQDAITEASSRLEFRNVKLDIWAGRLCIFSDPHLPTVFYHLLDNSLHPSTRASRILITYRILENGCSIVIEDNGIGIPDSEKTGLFIRREDNYARGLYLASEIVSLTGITVQENGTYLQGARFELFVPSEGYRIEGMTWTQAGRITHIPHDHSEEKSCDPGPVARELLASEFSLADTLWLDYHETKGDPAQDRIFGVFVAGDLVSIARCRRHPDGLEVDGVFTPVLSRGKGYSSLVMEALTGACHNDDLFMYAVRHLEKFYGRYGFEPIPESILPPTIRERYTWATGNLEGAEVLPMRRQAGFP